MEYLDIVNDADEVIGRASQAEVYANRHPHRIVHILIFNDQNEMALQLRSRSKSFCPLHWSTAVGGHVQAGEAYEQAAVREGREEAGVELTVAPLFTDIYRSETQQVTKHLVTFFARHNGPFPNLGSDEVEEIRFFPLDTVRAMVAEGEKFHPELLFLLKSEKCASFAPDQLAK